MGSAPRGVSALECGLQVAIVVVREQSQLERVGDRCRSLAIRLSQRNSTHMLGASRRSLHVAQHSAAREQEVHHAAPNRRLSRMRRVSADDLVLGRGAKR